MGKAGMLDRLRYVVCIIAWKLFLWSIKMTEDEYFDSIYEQEKEWRRIIQD